MKKTVSLFIAGVLFASTLSGCTNTSTQTKTEGPQMVKVGVIAPLSGPAANYGEDAVNAYKYVVKKFNAENSGKIEVNLVIEDGKCDGKTASSAAQKLISVDGVQAIVGGICSVETIPAGKIAQANKVVMIAPVSSAAEISNIGDYVFRYRNDANVTKKLGDYLNKSDAKNLFVLMENTDYGVGYAQGVKESFSGNVIEEKFQSDEKDFNILAKKILNTDSVDSILIVTNSDSNTKNIINAFDKQGILTKFKGHIYGTELTVSDGVMKDLGNLLNGVKATNLISMEELGQRATSFMKEFSSTNTTLSAPLWIVLESEAMKITLDAITKVGNDGTAIKDYFTSFSDTNPRQGYFGDYYFTPERDAHGLSFLVYEIQNGKIINGK